MHHWITDYQISSVLFFFVFFVLTLHEIRKKEKKVLARRCEEGEHGPSGRQKPKGQAQAEFSSLLAQVSFVYVIE
jgi:hypothetical protein